MHRISRPVIALCLLGCAASSAASPATEKEQSLKELRAAIVKRIATTPCGVKPRHEAQFKVLLQDNGYLAGVVLVRSSGAPAFDASLMNAIAGAQPYRLPATAAARKELLNLNLKFDANSTPLPPCR